MSATSLSPIENWILTPYRFGAAVLLAVLRLARVMLPLYIVWANATPGSSPHTISNQKSRIILRESSINC